jgi:hypothetical protein
MLKKIYQLFKSGSAEVDAPRAVILHGHIFKNAGSTFDWSLERNFGAGFCDHRDDMDMRKGGADYLADYLAVNSTLNALSSHHLCSPPPKSESINLVRVFLFRHPIARVRSVYDFERKQPEVTPGSIYANKYNFSEYVSWRMRPEVNPTIRNYQLRYCLPGKHGRSELNDSDLDQVYQDISSCALVGVVDRYDESMVVFEESLRALFPNIDLSYVIQNVSGKSAASKSSEEKSGDVLNEIGTISSLLLDNNRLDMKLYELSNDLLDSRIKLISNFEKKLMAFGLRCAKLCKNIG